MGEAVRDATAEQVRALVQRYEQGLTYYASARSGYNETDTRVEFIDPLLGLLGWDVNNSRGVRADLREVIREESNRSEGVSSKPDYTLRKGRIRRCYVEAKKPSIRIESDPEPARQVRKYGFTSGLPISVLTNFQTLSIYDTRFPTQPSDTAHAYRLLKLDYTEYEERWQELSSLIGRHSVQHENWLSDGQLTAQTSPLSINEVFIDQYNSWRIRLAQGLVARDSRISDETVNDVVQRLLNRLVFVRMCEDRGIEGSESLLRAKESETDLSEFFRRLNRRYNTGLFDQSLRSVEPVGLIDSRIVSEIVTELYSPFSTVSYAVLDTEFLGMVYETSLAEHLVVERGSGHPVVTLAPKKEYAAREVVTTPQPLVDMTVDLTLTAFFSGCSTDVKPRVLDFAAGSGRFLLAAFSWLVNWTVNQRLATGDTSDLRQTSASDWTLSFEAKRKLLEEQLFGIDIDYMAVEIARFSLLIHLLEDETQESLPPGTSILPGLQTNILHGNTLVRNLVVSNSQDQLDLTRPLPLPREGFPEEFEVVVGNPPYVKTSAIKRYDLAEYEYLKDNYDLLHQQFDKYLAFIEFGWNHLSANGFLGAVVPNKWMTNVSGEILRQRLRDNGALRHLINFRDVQLFPGKTAYICVMVLGRAFQPSFSYDEPKGPP